jgi:hypothetical protein
MLSSVSMFRPPSAFLEYYACLGTTTAMIKHNLSSDIAGLQVVLQLIAPSRLAQRFVRQEEPLRPLPSRTLFQRSRRNR